MRKTEILAKRKTPARKITHTQDPLHEDPCEDPFKVPCLTDDPCENVVEYPYKLTPVKRKDEQGHNNKMISEEMDAFKKSYCSSFFSPLKSKSSILSHQHSFSFFHLSIQRLLTH